MRTVRYDLEETYEGIYDRVVAGVESLHLAPYSLEDYKKANIERDDFELGRQHALVGIFQSRYLKRFESSVDAFRDRSTNGGNWGRIRGTLDEEVM